MKKIICLLFLLGAACQLTLCAQEQQDSFSADIIELLKEKDDKAVLGKTLMKLDKMEEEAINRFANEFITQSKKEGRIHLMNDLVMRLYSASIPKAPTGRLLQIMKQYGVLIGEQAPPFAVKGKTLADLLTDDQQVLLFFYESDCDICHGELEKLETMVSGLETKNVTLVSIDCNAEVETPHSWQYNQIDTNGKIYLPYGIMKIPTYILIDKDGLVSKRFSKLEDLFGE